MTNEEKLAVFKKLVSINSINDNENDVAKYLKTLFDQADIECKIIPVTGNRSNLIAEIGSGKPILVVSGHMDTVDVDTDNWNTDPFTLTADGDDLYGRGATDMKGGLAAIVIAMIELKQSNTPINGTIRFLATLGEEVGQLGAEKLTEQGYMNDVDGLLIGEPAGYRAVYANKGELDITLNSVGKAAHSSMPNLGINAVENLIHIINNISNTMTAKTKDITNDVLGGTIFNIDIFHGGSQINAIPGSASAGINIRTIPEFNNDDILQTISECVDDFNSNNNGEITYTVDMNIIPVLGDPNSKLIKLVKEIGNKHFAKVHYSEADIQKGKMIEKLVGLPFSSTEILTMGVSGGTDASKFLIDKPVGANYIVFGPGNDTSHKDNENVSKAMYYDFIEMYKEIFTEYFE
ncbi:ArgE/DapE family deacylase [Companilactobacillus hulinensis]|uniref:ArgE/DapE family deacylase n=1 Tax=Companilactobacillus hulinensis TaxID=2486007 RepID=UPI000F78BB16|nr:ArgE/DapE family deacylase [Companilactobacillus hulinensis]